MAVWGLTKEDAESLYSELKAEGYFDRILKKAYPNGLPNKSLSSRGRRGKIEVESRYIYNEHSKSSIESLVYTDTVVGDIVTSRYGSDVVSRKCIAKDEESISFEVVG